MGAKNDRDVFVFDPWDFDECVARGGGLRFMDL
jgi:hypothetical protein